VGFGVIHPVAKAKGFLTSLIVSLFTGTKALPAAIKGTFKAGASSKLVVVTGPKALAILKPV
jgi:hypothetical protein